MKLDKCPVCEGTDFKVSRNFEEYIVFKCDKCNKEIPVARDYADKFQQGLTFELKRSDKDVK